MNPREAIQKARELADTATPGPWRTSDPSSTGRRWVWTPGPNFSCSGPDATFIAASRQLVPLLLDIAAASEYALRVLIAVHARQANIEVAEAESDLRAALAVFTEAMTERTADE